MIEFHEVSKRYAGGNEALSGLSFTAERGEMLFVTGPSGAGKSTLLKLLALIERPSRGQIIVNGRNLGGLRRRQIPHYRRQVGVIFQDHKLLLERSVFDNVALPLVISGVPGNEIPRRVGAALELVGLLHKERALPIQLSTGEQQRVGIARAVISRPPILIADEPTGNLDPELSYEVMRLFQRLNQVGITVLVASHDHNLIRRLGQRFISLRAGRLVPPELAGGAYAGA
ncbi:MAG TPA: cell division ATP-binding protein FtsE [Gammaproteobacteria bacterium]|nr:cell division ATP-binding protein FtsE [Gammaproteobacteria bacterium]